MAEDAKLIGTVTAVAALTPTITASSQYTTGNVVGGLLAFPNVVRNRQPTGVLESIQLDLLSAQTCSFKVYFFPSKPVTSFTDKSAPSINAADAPNVIGPFTLSAYDSGLGTHTAYNLPAIGQGLSLAAGSTTLYAVVVVVGTPTFASASDLTISISVLQD
jgi:hypothetical protein